MGGGARDWSTQSPRIIGTCFNGGGLRSHSRMRKYFGYLETFRPCANISKTNGKPTWLTIANREDRDSNDGATTPIWAKSEFKPARFRLIHGEAELLRRMDIIKKLGLPINARPGKFKGGRRDGFLIINIAGYIL